MMNEDLEQPRFGVDQEGFGPAPFDESSTGDCILQSSDGTKYKIHRTVLALASVVFRDMWEVGTEGLDIPIVELTESSDVVYNLLLHLYPTTTPSVGNFTLALGLMDACDKYLINHQGFALHFGRILHSFWSRGSEADMLDAYCLAWRLNMRERAQNSSQYLHALDLARPGLRQEIEKKAHDVGALLALWDLRYRREVAVDSFIERLPLELYRCPDHRRLTSEETRRLRRKVRKALDRPCFSFKSGISQHSGLSGVLETPCKTSRSSNLRPLDERNPQSSSQGLRQGNPPCPACRATMVKSRRSNLDNQDVVWRAARDIPEKITWPSDKPAMGCF